MLERTLRPALPELFDTKIQSHPWMLCSIEAKNPVPENRQQQLLQRWDKLSNFESFRF